MGVAYLHEILRFVWVECSRHGEGSRCNYLKDVEAS